MRIVKELVQTITSWMPDYFILEDRNLSNYWYLRTSAKGRNRGTMVFHRNYGLRVRIDDPVLVKELKTLVLINNMEGVVSVFYINRGIPYASK